jgi:hypothetical protein
MSSVPIKHPLHVKFGWSAPPPSPKKINLRSLSSKKISLFYTIQTLCLHDTYAVPVPSKAYYQIPCQAQTSVTTDPDLTGFMDLDPDPGRQCCGTVTIYYGSGSGSGSDF